MALMPTPRSGRALVPSARTRAGIVRRLSGAKATITTQALKAMEERLDWFNDLGAEERSWITLIAQQGIDGLVAWLSDKDRNRDPAPSLFDAAPRTLTREITLGQTVDLVRVTIDVVEEQIAMLMPRNDRQILKMAVLHYSREIAFAAAEVYARAAESRGNWDARLEAMVVDAVVRAETDETVLSRASTLGWHYGTPHSPGGVCVLVGRAPETSAGSIEGMRRQGEKHGVSVLAATQGMHLVAILGGETLTSQSDAVRIASLLEGNFGAGPVVVGSLVEGLNLAYISAREANSGLRAAVAWPEGPRTLAASELLPERALAGDGHARRELAQTIYDSLADAGADLLATCAAFLDHGGSVEASARALFVHANTVRYRLKRIQDVTGYAPGDPRDGYVLRLAITLGRLQHG